MQNDESEAIYIFHLFIDVIRIILECDGKLIIVETVFGLYLCLWVFWERVLWRLTKDICELILVQIDSEFVQW